MKKQLDARGMQCPLPVIETKKALKEMTEGTLEVLVDDEIAVQNLRKLGSYLNIVSSVVTASENQFQVVFELNEAKEAKEALPKQTTPKELDLNDSKSGTVVVLSGSYMGSGDDVLGGFLMKGFLYALAEGENPPDMILLYNGGASLSIEGSESLEDLKKLESLGTEILTCGTCLKHYGLEEKLGVGSVTNMYTIVETMMRASHIVKP